jgi:hypothetical protein
MLHEVTWLWQFEAIAFAPQNPANIAFELPIEVNVGQVSIKRSIEGLSHDRTVCGEPFVFKRLKRFPCVCVSTCEYSFGLRQYVQGVDCLSIAAIAGTGGLDDGGGSPSHISGQKLSVPIIISLHGECLELGKLMPRVNWEKIFLQLAVRLFCARLAYLNG